LLHQVNLALTSFTIAWYQSSTLQNIVCFWSSTQYQTSHILTFQGLLFLSGLLFVVQADTVTFQTIQVQAVIFLVSQVLLLYSVVSSNLDQSCIVVAVLSANALLLAFQLA
jgi:hypothetical protein